MNHVLFFVAEEGFRDEEYFEPKQVLEDAGMVCDVVSTNDNQAVGKLGVTIMPTVSLHTLDISIYDAIVLVGGPGAPEMGENILVQSIIQEAYEKKKTMCAICIAPTILAKLGMLKKKHATVFESGKEILEENGAIYCEDPVVVDSSVQDHKIITANGPSAAMEFGQTIKRILSNELVH